MLVLLLLLQNFAGCGIKVELVQGNAVVQSVRMVPLEERSKNFKLPRAEPVTVRIRGDGSCGFEDYEILDVIDSRAKATWKIEVGLQRSMTTVR